MLLYGLGGVTICERIEKLRGLRWLVAKLRHRPTRFKVVEKLDVTHVSCVKRELP